MRVFDAILATSLLALLSPLCESALSNQQIDVLLEQYEAGIQSGKFQYRDGKARADLVSYLKNGELPAIRQEVLLSVPQHLPKPQSENLSKGDSEWSEGGFQTGEASGGTWASEAGWREDSQNPSEKVSNWILAIAEAAATCNYAEAKRLADLVLDLDPSNEWILENYGEIDVWADRSERYYEALSAAYEALEIGNLSILVAQLRDALENAASNCGQDTIARSLLDQALETSKSEREAAIAQARQEGAIHQQTFAQSQAAQAAFNASQEESKSGMKRGLMGLLNTAVKVGALKKGSGISGEDALVQVLQQQALQANPEIAQLVTQAQQLQAGGGNADPAALLQSLQQQTSLGNPQPSQMNQTGTQGNSPGTFTMPTNANGAGNSNVTVSPICQQLMDRLTVLGKEVTALSQVYMTYQGNSNVSQAQIQSTAAKMMMLHKETSALVQQLKANNCPGSENIPDMPTY